MILLPMMAYENRNEAARRRLHRFPPLSSPRMHLARAFIMPVQSPNMTVSIPRRPIIAAPHFTNTMCAAACIGNLSEDTHVVCFVASFEEGLYIVSILDFERGSGDVDLLELMRY